MVDRDSQRNCTESNLENLLVGRLVFLDPVYSSEQRYRMRFIVQNREQRSYIGRPVAQTPAV
jgi:hypothetical protein